MQTTAVGPAISATRNSPSSAAPNAASADFENFLRLLTAQLRNQDPLSPLDSTQFVAQLASFSTVEQLVGANDRLQSLLDQSGAGGLEDYAPWIGRTVETLDGDVVFAGAPVAYRLTPVDGADSAAIVVRDASGNVVHRAEIAVDAAPKVWDGAGAPAHGRYSIAIEQFAGGDLVDAAPPLTADVVLEARRLAGGVELALADGSVVAPTDVVALR